jgi:hypothetical protein
MRKRNSRAASLDRIAEVPHLGDSIRMSFSDPESIDSPFLNALRMAGQMKPWSWLLAIGC